MSQFIKDNKKSRIRNKLQQQTENDNIKKGYDYTNNMFHFTAQRIKSDVFGAASITRPVTGSSRAQTKLHRMVLAFNRNI